MDWNSILTLINGADTLLGVAILIVAARYGFRALRWSEPRPYQDTEWHQEMDTSIKDCHICNPQPTQSERRSEAGAGKNGG